MCLKVPTAIKDPNSDDPVVSNEQIKKVTLAYCLDNLTKKLKDKIDFNGLEYKKLLNDQRMNEVDIEEDLEIGKGDFTDVLKGLVQRRPRATIYY